jgi:plastocyanin
MSVAVPTQPRTIMAACCLVGLLLATACVPLIRDPHAAMLTQAAGATPASPTASLTSATASMAQTNAQVVIDNFTFTPDIITVTVGTTVTWSNQDDTPHTVTAADKRFASKGLDTGDQFAYRFTAAGVYTYFCSIHPVMIGHIIVQ